MKFSKPHLLWFLAGLCVAAPRLTGGPLLPSDGSVNFSVSGFCLQTNNQGAPMPEGRLPRSSRLNFTFERRGKNWHLKGTDSSLLFNERVQYGKSRTPDQRFTGVVPTNALQVNRSFEAGIAGNQIYTLLSLSAASGRAQVAENDRSQGAILPDSSLSLDPRLGALWLAFGQSSAGDQAYEVELPWTARSKAAIGQISPCTNAPFLPKEVIFFEKHNPASAIGYLRVNRTTNFNGLVLPVSFTVTHLQQPATDAKVAYELAFVIDKFEPCSITNFLPELKKAVVILDYRFGDAKLGIRELIYTNSQWLPRNAPFLQKFVAAKRRQLGAHGLNEDGKSWIRVALLSMILAPAGLLIFKPLWKCYLGKDNKNANTVC